MKSRSASVVGAMTRAARASRNRRSMPSSLRNAAPPHTFIARSVTSIGGLGRGALTLEHPQHGVRPLVHQRGQRVDEERARSRRSSAASGRSRCGPRLLRQRLVEVLEPRRREVRACVSAVTASINPTLNAALEHEEPRQRRSSAMSRPAPSSPSIARLPARCTLVGGHRGRAVAAQAEPVERAAHARGPGVVRGTNHSVMGPSAASGRLDHT